MALSSSPDHEPGPRVDPAALRRALQRAAPTYDEAALLAREVQGRLLERLDLMQVDPGRLLVVDARTGADARALARRFPKAAKYLADPAPVMLNRARKKRGWRSRQHFCTAWSGALPFPDGYFDLIWSNLGLPWTNDLDTVLRELRRVVAPEGLVLFSSLGPDTLAELRQALPAAFGRVPDMPVFLDMHDVGDALSRAGLEGVVMENELLTVTYPDLRALLRDARATASGALMENRPRGLLTPRRLAALDAALPREAGRLPARFEVVYGHAWRPERSGAAADDSGIARIGIDQIGRAPGTR
ncbi:methyltransferase domain-containing protein [Thiohalorhabdus methylotrophus]|uniref:Malonyl-[acyl-carrier protein] O-methyltransferase n=1 Tax=Thiohalorhabdus methylotrophus TaxID=3242694 RepID=A0ABV4TRU0_9GAMM